MKLRDQTFKITKKVGPLIGSLTVFKMEKNENTDFLMKMSIFEPLLDIFLTDIILMKVKTSPELSFNSINKLIQSLK